LRATAACASSSCCPRARINQDTGHEVRSACRLALARLSGERVLPDQECIHVDIFLKDKLP